MRKLFLTVISCVLLLAMLAVPMTALADDSTASDTPDATAASVKLDQVDEWQFADNYYQSNWATGKINTNNNQLLKADDTKDMISWNSPAAIGGTAAVALENGELTFSNSHIWGFSTKINPGQMSTNKLDIGPTMIGFDVYMGQGSGMGSFLSYNIGGHKVMKINQIYGLITDMNNGSLGGGGLTQYNNRPAGWYTMEFIFIPLTAEDDICITAEQTVAKTKMYMRISVASETVATAPTRLLPDDLATWTAFNMTNMTNHFVNLEQSSSLGIDDGAGGTFKIRRAKASNLIPKDLIIADFAGFPALATGNQAGQPITLPSADGVAAWELDGKYYVPGEQYIINEPVEFKPLSSKIWNVVKGYDTSALWATGAPNSPSWEPSAVFHSGEGFSPIIQWYKKDNGASTYTYDPAEKSITITNTLVDGDGGGNTIDWFLKRAALNKDQYANATAYVFSVDILYTADSFDPITIQMNWNSTIGNISAEGAMTIGSTTVGNLVAGWNTVKFYFVPNAAVTAWTIYASLNTTEIGASIAATDFLTLPSVQWTSGAFTNDLPRLRFLAATPTADSPKSITARNFMSYGLTASVVNYVSFAGETPLQIVPAGESIILPTVDGASVWWTDGTKVYESLTDYVPTAGYTVLRLATDDEIAYLELVQIVNSLNDPDAGVISETDYITMMLRLKELMATDGLNPEDERYIAGAEAVNACMTALEEYLAEAISQLNLENAEEWFAGLQDILNRYLSIKAYASETYKTTLSVAINAYNAFADSINADMEEATDIALTIIAFKQSAPAPATATLADIKSKTSDEE